MQLFKKRIYMENLNGGNKKKSAPNGADLFIVKY